MSLGRTVVSQSVSSLSLIKGGREGVRLFCIMCLTHTRNAASPPSARHPGRWSTSTSSPSTYNVELMWGP